MDAGGANRSAGGAAIGQREQRERNSTPPTAKNKKNDTHTIAQEDEELKRLVIAHGPQKWSVVAERIKGRSGKSCRLR